MTDTEKIREYIETLEGTITYDGCDSALYGVAKLIRKDTWVDVAIYSYEKLVEHFKQEFLSDAENPLTEDEAEVDAIEWVDFNVAGGYLGIYTPLIISEENSISVQ